jgi:dihydropyrimidinase
MYDLMMHNGVVVTPEAVIHGGVSVDNGIIVRVGPDADLGEARQVINLEGRVLLPGLFDPHTHLGLSESFGPDTMVEDFRRNTKDALVGGVTTLATTTMPGRSPLDEQFDTTLLAAAGHSWCDYKISSIVGLREQIADIPAVAARGGMSYKFFTGYVGDQAVGLGYPPEGVPPDFFMLACEQLRKVGRPAFPMIHAEDPYVRGVLVDRLRATGRADHLVAWAEASPSWAESVQIYTYGQVAQDAGVPLYPVHLSAAESVDTVQWMQRDGVEVIAETVVHSLCTTADEMDRLGMGAKAKVQPPIRFERDRERLWQGLREGTITIVGTDSLSYSAQQREDCDFWDCRVGLPLQVADTLPLMYTEGVAKGRIDLLTLARVLSTNAAKTYGIFPKKGAIAPGSDADLVVVDPYTQGELGTSRYRGSSDYTIWQGRKVVGIPTMTVLRGQVVMQDGEITASRATGEHVQQVSRPPGL